MKKLSARRLATAAATTAAVTLGLLGAAAAVPAAAFAAPAAPAATGNNALLAAINDARLHPEKYAPHGNATGATMTGCTNPFIASAALYRGANDHDKFLATQTVAWLSGIAGQDAQGHDRPNAHMDPNGAMAWEDNGHIVAAGYRSARAEIVAWSQTSAVAAVRAWMQDDASHGWGHRNIILNCSYTYAGASAYTGGPAGHYYTADMGNK